MRTALALGLLSLALAAAPAAAGPNFPDLALSLGGTTAVEGTPGKGGVSASLSGLWPVEGPLSFGLTAIVDDMGTELAQFTQPGPPLTLLGTYPRNHRFVYGGGWRLDCEPATLRRWRPFASATWAYLRIQDDERGTIVHAQSATAFGLGLGARRNILQHSTVGAVVRYQHLADDRVERYVTAAVEWGWRFEGTKTR